EAADGEQDRVLPGHLPGPAVFAAELHHEPGDLFDLKADLPQEVGGHPHVAGRDLHRAGGDPALHQLRGEQLELRRDVAGEVVVDQVAIHCGATVQGVCRRPATETPRLFTG